MYCIKLLAAGFMKDYTGGSFLHTTEKYPHGLTIFKKILNVIKYLFHHYSLGLIKVLIQHWLKW